MLSGYFHYGTVIDFREKTFKIQIMKLRAIFIVTFLLLLCTFIKGEENQTSNTSNAQNAFKAYSSPNVFGLMNNLVENYSKGQSKSIEILRADETQFVQTSENEDAVFFVSDQDNLGSFNYSNWKIVVAQDIVVPILNFDHPLIEQFSKTGVSINDFQKILKENPSDWSKVLGVPSDYPIHLYVSSNSFVKGTLNKLADLDLSNQIRLVDENEIISKIQGDKFAIGFCNLSQLTEESYQALPQRISIMPVDKNGNGKLDYVENIYENLLTFQRGVWIGKYPKMFSNSIYAVSKSKPANNDEIAFLKWILTDGQKYLSISGYSDLVYAERLSQLSKFDSPDNLASVPVESAKSLMSIILLVLVGIIAIGIILDLVFRRIIRPAKHHEKLLAEPFFSEQSVTIPRGIYFDKTHTWAFMKKNGLVKIGIDDFMMHVTGEVSKVDLKETGTNVKKGEILFSIISKGRFLNFYSPVSGTIVEKNDKLKSNPSLLSSSPYSDGWVYNIQPLNWGLEIQYLSLAEKFSSWISNEFSRLKDFISSELGKDLPELNQVVLQDGGSLKNNVLADMTPKIWEDFQTKFIDVSK